MGELCKDYEVKNTKTVYQWKEDWPFLLGIKENTNLGEVYLQTCFKVYLIPLGSVTTHMW